MGWKLDQDSLLWKGARQSLFYATIGFNGTPETGRGIFGKLAGK
jgi:hypothetical protein